MTVATLNNVFGAYANLLEQAPLLAHIDGEQEYEAALEFIECLMETIGDNPDDSRWGLLEIATKMVEQYEARLHPEFEELFDENTGPASVIRVLTDQYQLDCSDLPEIGTQEMVSEVVNGTKDLTLPQIRALSSRFHIAPALFI